MRQAALAQREAGEDLQSPARQTGALLQPLVQPLAIVGRAEQADEVDGGARRVAERTPARVVRVHARDGRAHEERGEQEGVEAEARARAAELELAGRDPGYLRAVPHRHAGDARALPGAERVVRVLLRGRAVGAELVVAPLELPELVGRVQSEDGHVPEEQRLGGHVVPAGDREVILTKPAWRLLGLIARLGTGCFMTTGLTERTGGEKKKKKKCILTKKRQKKRPKSTE